MAVGDKFSRSKVNISSYNVKKPRTIKSSIVFFLNLLLLEGKIVGYFARKNR
jgi:hypothetical protein